MKKRTKIISMAIALVLVMGVMAVGIWAATAANAGITANVSWSAQAGVEFELEAWAVNNNQNGVDATSTPKSIEKIVVDKGTSNTDASGLGGDLSVGFYDVDAGTPSDDGVNNPSPIVFTYKIKNTGYTILKVTTTKSPVTQNESGTTASDHKPAVELNTSYEGDKITTSQTSSLTGTGYNVPVGGTLTYTVTLSIENGDLDINSFDAGVIFNFGIANSSTEVYVNNALQGTVSSATTIGECVSALDGKNYPGYYYDEALTVPVPVSDYDITLGSGSVALFTKPATLDKLTFTSNGDGTCSVAGNSPEGEVIIPLVSPAGDRVTGIGGNAFEYCESLTSITIPDGVTSIGSYAFPGTSLTSITIPDSVTSIGDSAFFFCGLTSINIPDSVTSIGSYAFKSCGNLKTVTIGKGLSSLGSSAFADCSGLTSITVSTENETYDSRNNCNAIIETSTNTLISGCPGTIILNGVTSIGSYAFKNCTSLTNITIPNSVTSIGTYAFDSCTSLISVILGSGLTSIEDSAFRSAGITSITIPDSVTSIGESAFADCIGLTSITIGSGVTNIGANVFAYCNKLTSITIPDSVTSIGESAFLSAGITSITIPDSVTSIGESVFSGCSGLINAIIGNGLTSLGKNLFKGCTSLASVYVPSSVTTISASSYSSSPFYNCKSTLKIYCGASSKPSGWGTYWNRYGSSSSKTLSVTWGVTREVYNNTYA